MLKKRLRLFLGLIVLTGSAYVTPTYASSALPSVVIASIQPSGPSGPKEEAITLYNNTSSEITITNWCLANKMVIFYCFKSPDDAALEYVLPAHAHAVIVSKGYASQSSTTAVDVPLVYEVTNKTSGSITGSSDTLSLINTDGTLEDRHSWSTSLANGLMYIRKEEAGSPMQYANTGLPSDWTTSTIALPSQGVETRQQSTGGSDVPSSAAQSAIPLITEVLPNPSGLDEGREFIELYNPSATQAVLLDTVRVQVGTTSPKTVAFEPGGRIEPLQYRAFYNDEVAFTLPNTAGHLELIFQGRRTGSAVNYSSAKDDQSWALGNGGWQYTSNVTPGAENQFGVVLRPSLATPASAEDDTRSAASNEPKACAEGSTRNLATGRCKKLVVSLSTSKAVAASPCKEGYERNSETNRCRKRQAVAQVAACKKGQERSPETNRCRTVAKMTVADHSVKSARETTGVGVAWYVWLAIAGVVALVVAYGVWEWRTELGVFGKKLLYKFAKRSR